MTYDTWLFRRENVSNVMSFARRVKQTYEVGALGDTF